MPIQLSKYQAGVEILDKIVYNYVKILIKL